MSLAHYHALRAQAAHLRDPNRRDGPSRFEAAAVADRMDDEADRLSQTLYREAAARVMGQIENGPYGRGLWKGVG